MRKPIPKPQRRLFKSSPTHLNVVLNFRKSPESEFGVYGHAFLEGARSLVNALSERPAIRDYEALPIVFLYRHAVELYLKAIIFWGNRLMAFDNVGVPGNELFKTFTRHELTPLFQRVEAVFEHVGWEWETDVPSVPTLRDARAVVSELDSVDGTSFAFRYPTDKTGEGSLEHHFSFNLAWFVEQIDPFVELLETAVFGLEAEWDKACSAYDSYGGE